MKANSSFLWNRLLKQMLSLATALAMVLATAPAPSFAQGKGRSPQRAAETGSAKNVRSQGSGQQEGIKVHGDWTITIRNGDGSVSSLYEFKNTLVGPELISRILARGGSAGHWLIFLNRVGTPLIPNPPLICESSGLPYRCDMSELFVRADTSSAPPNLVVSAPFAGPDAGALVAIGSIKASFPGQVVMVETAFATCMPNQVPSILCGTFPSSIPSMMFFGLDLFTRKDISTLNISVQAGQTIDVKVKISFS